MVLVNVENLVVYIVVNLVNLKENLVEVVFLNLIEV